MYFHWLQELELVAGSWCIVVVGPAVLHPKLMESCVGVLSKPLLILFPR